MKKLTLLLAIILTFSSAVPILGESMSENFLSIDNIKKHIEILSSEEFQGRLIGTRGNEKTVEYVKEHFEEYGLKPIGDSFTHEFEALNIEYQGVPRFNILDRKGNIVLSLQEGLDYKIRLDDYSFVGSFKGDIHYIDNKEQILRNQYNYDNLAVLLDYNNESIKEIGQNQGQIDDRIFYKGAKVLIYPEYGSISLKDLNLGNKNVHLNQSGLIKLGVNPDIFESLISYMGNGYKIDIDIPIAFNNVKAANVIGVIEGKVKNYNNIIIATSIDGLGIDANGNVLPGAVDNGAATSLLLELSRILSTSKRMDSNIVFLGLNGNKLGDMGFDNFFRIEGIDPTHVQVIYLDKVGTINGDITVGTFANESTEFKLNRIIFNDLINTIDKMDLPYKKDENYFSSDYINFRLRGIKSFVLTNGFNENIGTINDKLENVDMDRVLDIGNITLNYISDFGNMNILKELLDIFKSIWYLVVIGIVLIAIYSLQFTIHNWRSLDCALDDIRHSGEISHALDDLRHRRHFDQRGEISNRGDDNSVGAEFHAHPIPLISAYLVIAFIIATLIIQTKHGIVLSQGVLYQDTSIGLMNVLNTFGESVLSSSLMFVYLCMYSLPLVLGLLILRYIHDRIKLSERGFLSLVCILSIFTVLYGFNKLYDYNYSSIFPKLLSLPNLNIILILCIGLYNCIVIYFLKKEKKGATTFKLIVVYIMLNILFVSAIYSPYIFNKTIINIRSTNGVLRF